MILVKLGLDGKTIVDYSVTTATVVPDGWIEGKSEWTFDVVGLELDVDTLTLNKTLDSVISDIKRMAAGLIASIEGAEKWRMQRAQERAKVFGDYAELDLIYAQKELVRVKSDEAELAVQSMTQEALNAFSFSVNLADAVIPTVNRITVGAFISRYTQAEYNRIKAAPEMEQALFGLQGRTHVDLSSPVTLQMVAAQDAFTLLGPVQDAETYADRATELLRAGETDEAYRGE